MKHPSQEEWMSFLYGESNQEARAQYPAHLRDCAKCQATVAAWRDAMKGLDTFKLRSLSERAVPTAFTPAFMKWGMAAMFILGLGFALGAGQLHRSSRIDAQQLRRDVAAEVREQVRQEIKTDLRAAVASSDADATNEFRRELRAAFDEWGSRQNATAQAQTQRLVAALTQLIASGRAEDRQTMLSLLRSLEQQNLAAFALLKKNLETVAVVADNRFLQTETQLGQLISYAQPKTE
jgi:anti-sigma factor RsiW